MPTLSRINQVVWWSNGLCGIMYVMVALFGYLLYLDKTQGDVLNNFGNSIFDDIARLLFAVSIVCHFLLVTFGFRWSFETQFFPKSPFTWLRHISVTIGIIATTLLLGTLAPQLEQVTALAGSL